MTDQAILLRCRECRTLNRVPYQKVSARPICAQCKAKLEYPLTPVIGKTGSFEQEVYEWPENLLLEFWAKWCGFCRMAEPVLQDLASWRAGRLKVVKIDIDAEPELARRFSVRATPTFIMFKNGVQTARLDGAPKEKIDLVKWVDQVLK